MKKIQKTVEVYDCGVPSHYHLNAGSAVSCKKFQDNYKKQELKRLKIFKRYMTTRISMGAIGAEFKIAEPTVRKYCRDCIIEFMKEIFTDAQREAYGDDWGLPYAVTNWTDFWVANINKRLRHFDT